MGNTGTKQTIIGPALPNIPWEDKPADCHDVVWRSSRNPIIPRDLIPSSNSIFNSAVVPFEGAFAGVFRCDDRRRFMQLHSGKSQDRMGRYAGLDVAPDFIIESIIQRNSMRTSMATMALVAVPS